MSIPKSTGLFDISANIFPNCAFFHSTDKTPLTKEEILKNHKEFADANFGRKKDYVQKPSDPIIRVQTNDGTTKDFSSHAEAVNELTENSQNYQKQSNPNTSAETERQENLDNIPTFSDTMNKGSSAEIIVSSKNINDITAFKDAYKPTGTDGSDIEAQINKELDEFNKSRLNVIGSFHVSVGPIDSTQGESMGVTGLNPFLLTVKNGNTFLDEFQNILVFVDKEGKVKKFIVYDMGDKYTTTLTPTQMGYLDTVDPTIELKITDFMNVVLDKLDILRIDNQGLRDYKHLPQPLVLEKNEIIFSNNKNKTDFFESIRVFDGSKFKPLDATDIEMIDAQEKFPLTEGIPDGSNVIDLLLEEINTTEDENFVKGSRVTVMEKNADGKLVLKIVTLNAEARPIDPAGDPPSRGYEVGDLIYKEIELQEGEVNEFPKLLQLTQREIGTGGDTLSPVCSESFEGGLLDEYNNTKVLDLKGTKDKLFSQPDDNNYILCKTDKLDQTNMYDESMTEDHISLDTFKSEYPDALYIKKNEEFIAIFFKLTPEGYIEKYSVATLDEGEPVKISKQKLISFDNSSLFENNLKHTRPKIEDILQDIMTSSSVEESKKEPDTPEKAAELVDETCKLARFQNFPDNTKNIFNSKIFYLWILLIIFIIFFVIYKLIN
jgi:hypothetical protein